MEILLIFILLICLVWFIISGTEYAYVIGGLSVVGMLLFGYGDFLAILPQRIFSQLDIFTLMALPLFILAAEIMSGGGITKVLIDFAMAILGRSPGALGNVNVMTSIFFGGVSGSAIADAASLGNALVPAMKERGYTAEYAASITAASAIIGPIIPPSIIMILYGAIMQTDIAALFAGGLIPGLLLGGTLIIANTIISIRQNHPRGEAFSSQRLIRTFINAAPALCLPIVIMAGIVFGLTTPTEAGAVAVLVAILASFYYRTFSRKLLLDCLRRTVIVSGAMFMMLAATSLISYLAILTDLPTVLSQVVAKSGLQGTYYLLALVGILLVFGMFTGVRVAMFLVVPLIAPEAIAQGFDPVHLGVVICLTLALGLITPPLGPVLLVLSSVSGLSYQAMVRGTFVFICVEVALLAVIMFVPDLSLILPKQLGLSP